MKYFLTETLTVRRLKAIDSYRNAYSATSTAYPCSKQDIDFGQQQSGYQLGKSYQVFIDNSEADVQAGDQIVIDGVTYSVKEIEVIDFGVQPYKGLVVVKE